MRSSTAGVCIGHSGRVTEPPRAPYIQHSDGSIRQGRRVPPGSSVLDRVGGLDMTFVRVDHYTRLHFGAFETLRVSR